MGDYCPGAEQSPQRGGGGLNKSLPPRATWHITWDALRPDGSQPQFSAVSNYLKNVGYCPHIMWNPFTGYIEQYYPASQSARALAAWNEDGAVNVQIEVFFTPGCVVDGIKYNTVAETPLKGFGTIMGWLDGLGIPREWPLGVPQWQGNSRTPDVWNSRGGHYGHCHVPDNTHTDPGPMPAFTTITAQSANIKTIQEDDMPSVNDLLYAPIPKYDVDGNEVGTTTLAEVTAWNEANFYRQRKLTIDAIKETVLGVLTSPVPNVATGDSTNLATEVSWLPKNFQRADGGAVDVDKLAQTIAAAVAGTLNADTVKAK